MKRLSVILQKTNNNAIRCYISRHEFLDDEAMDLKVRDNENLTGCLIGAAHRQCNLECPVKFKVQMFFNNFRGNDAYLIVYEFGKRSHREIKVIGQNMKKYLQVE